MSRRPSLAVRFLPALIASTIVLVASQRAHAKSGTAIGADLDYTNGIDEAEKKGGTGFNVRLGYKLDLKLLQLTPEIGGGYHTFGGDASAKFSQGILGARVSFLKVLEPGVYAHIGYGHISSRLGDSRSATTADAGVTLDLTILPLIDLGLHGGYNGLLKSGGHPAFDTYVVGLHGALIF
jgi:hypothetical protein